MRKIIAVLLTVLMLASVLAALPASAATVDGSTNTDSPTLFISEVASYTKYHAYEGAASDSHALDYMEIYNNGTDSVNLSTIRILRAVDFIKRASDESPYAKLDPYDSIAYDTFWARYQKFIAKVEAALENEGVEAAKEICRNTRGPIASIYYQGLMRYDQGMDAVEKAVVSYGSVQTGQMESGLSWMGLFIALSPMLGFMGTVVGMIGAFDAIQAAGDISPTLVAGGIKVALLTTLMGLIAAVILQLFYNYVVTKIDALVNTMEDASITLVDILTAYAKK